MKRHIQQLSTVLSNNPVYLASPHIKFNRKTSQITTYEFANFLTKYEFINFYQIVSLLKEKEGCYTKEARL